MTDVVKNIKAWLVELRSERYPQSKEFLRSNLGYCCLGVACEGVLHLSSYTTEKNSSIGGLEELVKAYKFRSGGTTDASEMPGNSYEDLGLLGHLGEFSDHAKSVPTKKLGSPMRSLAELNDDGWTFIEIADFIEDDLVNNKGILFQPDVYKAWAAS